MTSHYDRVLESMRKELEGTKDEREKKNLKDAIRRLEKAKREAIGE